MKHLFLSYELRNMMENSHVSTLRCLMSTQNNYKTLYRRFSSEPDRSMIFYSKFHFAWQRLHSSNRTFRILRYIKLKAANAKSMEEKIIGLNNP